MAKQRRVGLHKQVSSIFKDVSIPADDVPEGYPPKSEAEPAGKISSETILHALPTTEGLESVAEDKAIPSEPEKREPQREPEPAALSSDAPPPVQQKARVAPRAPVFSPIQHKLQTLRDKLLAPKKGVNPRKQRTMLVLIPVLFFVLVFVIFRFHLNGSAHPNADDKTASTRNNTVVSAEITWEIPEPLPATLRDPMQVSLLTVRPDPKPEHKEQKTEALIVKGILRDSTKPSAVVGSTIVHEGDVVQGATVVKINRRDVMFERAGKTWTQEVQRRIKNSVQESDKPEATNMLK